MSKENSKFYKTIVQVEIISQGEFDYETLDEVHAAITEGDCSGLHEITEVRELSRREAALELIEHESDPDLLFGEDGWRYAVSPNDEVRIASSEQIFGSFVVQQIEYIEGDDPQKDRVRITDKNGEEIECLVSELR